MPGTVLDTGEVFVNARGQRLDLTKPQVVEKRALKVQLLQLWRIREKGRLLEVEGLTVVHCDRFFPFGHNV